MAEKHPMEGKYFALSLEGNAVDSQGALVIFRVKKGTLDMIFDPEENGLAEHPTDSKARDFLKGKRVKTVYTLGSGAEIRPGPILGFELFQENGDLWRSYRSLEDHYWENFFQGAGMTLRTYSDF